MTYRPIAFVLTGALLLGACGGGGGDSSSSAAGPGTASAPAGGAVTSVTLQDNTFVPADMTVDTGDLELVNDGTSIHNFSVEGEDVSVDVAAGGSASVAIDLAAGTYTVFCEFHRAQGMEGSLTVT
jgi:plastocyanin